MNWTFLLFIRVRQAHQDLQDVVDPEEVPSVHFLCFCSFSLAIHHHSGLWEIYTFTQGFIF